MSLTQYHSSIKNIGGDLGFNGKAVYLHGLLGMDKKYVSKSKLSSLLALAKTAMSTPSFTDIL